MSDIQNVDTLHHEDDAQQAQTESVPASSIGMDAGDVTNESVSEPLEGLEDAIPDASSQDIDVDTDDSEDSLTFSNGVIEKIVALAMRDVPGVVGMKGSWFNRVQDALGASDSRKGVTVEVTPDASVRVNISVLIKYGAYAPQVFEDVKKVVVERVMGMTGLVVSGVNLRIEDVLTPEEYAAQDMTQEQLHSEQDIS